MKHPIAPLSSLIVIYILLSICNISVVSSKKAPYTNTSIQRIDGSKVESSWLSSSKHQLFVRGGADKDDSDDSEYVDDSSDGSTDTESDDSEEIPIDSEQQSPSAAIRSITKSDESESSDTEDDAEDILLQQQYYQSHSHHHTHNDDEYYLKRGTRTTGVGAKSRQNQSIFSSTKQKQKHYTNKSYYSKLTSSALSGEILNRGKSKDDITKRHRGGGSKSSMGSSKIWVHQTKSNSLVFKFPRKGKDLYVELSESTPSNSRSSNKEKKSAYKPSVKAKYITNSQLLAKLSSSSASSKSSTSSTTSNSEKESTTPTPQFVPIEGIYGIYNLPISGPQLVLITSSEEIYSSPSLPQSELEELGDIDIDNDNDNDNDRRQGGKRGGRNERPLLELRRVKSMEIVSLRSKSKSQQSMPDGQLVEEEKRQLKLLRKSFKEHDLYFTPPSSFRTDGSVVVQDVTHSLQRSFVNWMGNSRRSRQQKWWIPYLTLTNNKDDATTVDRVVDPRFFWNEQPALSLLPPASSSSGVDNVKDESPHAMLLDHVIPVTSAFVGIQKNIPIPTTSSSSTSTSQDNNETNEKYDQVLISRRSKYRTGTRFTRRGCDDSGAVANYAETEQICFIVRDEVEGVNKDKGDEDKDSTTKKKNDNRELLEIYSHIQTRGSIPLHWSSPAKVNEYRPRVYIGVDPIVQARGLRDHLLGELAVYSSQSSVALDEERKFKSRRRMSKKEDKMTKVAIVNLIDKHGDQGRLGNAFDSILSAVLLETSSTIDTTTPTLGSNSIEHIWYDFHAECKGGRWDRLSLLLDQVTPTLNEQGYFSAVPSDNDDWEIQSLQDGVVRTNCMDCLDRTNVVQSMFGRYVLYRQLHERLGLTKADNGIIRRFRRRRTLPLEYVVGYKQHPLTLPWIEGEESHRYLWADNADAISRLYAGTPALKGDFTRTGKRTKKGAVDDGVNSLTRYYVNNFIDADRQEGMDLLARNVEFSSSTDDESARVLRNRGFQSSHARLKIEDEDGDSGSLKDTKSIMLPGDLYKHMTKDESRQKDITQPWWVSSHINNKKEKKDDIESKKYVLGKKGAVITSIVLLVKAPVISAGIVVAVIASELSNSLNKKTDKVVDSEK